MTSRKNRFGDELERMLRARGMNQKTFAEQIGTSSAYVSSISTGKRQVSPSRVSSIAAALHAEAGDISRLHRAAALDMGFNLDLPEDFDD